MGEYQDIRRPEPPLTEVALYKDAGGRYPITIIPLFDGVITELIISIS